MRTAPTILYVFVSNHGRFHRRVCMDEGVRVSVWCVVCVLCVCVYVSCARTCVCVCVGGCAAQRAALCLRARFISHLTLLRTPQRGATSTITLEARPPTSMSTPCAPGLCTSTGADHAADSSAPPNRNRCGPGRKSEAQLYGCVAPAQWKHEIGLTLRVSAAHGGGGGVDGGVCMCVYV